MRHYLQPNLGELTSIPSVIASGPWQFPREGGVEIYNGPGQHNDVIEVQQADNDLCPITKTWRRGNRTARESSERGSVIYSVKLLRSMHNTAKKFSALGPLLLPLQR